MGSQFTAMKIHENHIYIHSSLSNGLVWLSWFHHWNSSCHLGFFLLVFILARHGDQPYGRNKNGWNEISSIGAQTLNTCSSKVLPGLWVLPWPPTEPVWHGRCTQRSVPWCKAAESEGMTFVFGSNAWSMVVILTRSVRARRCCGFPDPNNQSDYVRSTGWHRGFLLQMTEAPKQSKTVLRCQHHAKPKPTSSTNCPPNISYSRCFREKPLACWRARIRSATEFWPNLMESCFETPRIIVYQLQIIQTISNYYTIRCHIIQQQCGLFQSWPSNLFLRFFRWFCYCLVRNPYVTLGFKVSEPQEPQHNPIFDLFDLGQKVWKISKVL